MTVEILIEGLEINICIYIFFSVVKKKMGKKLAVKPKFFIWHWGWVQRIDILVYYSNLDLEQEHYRITEVAHGLAFLCPCLLPLTTQHLLSICVEYVPCSIITFRKITNNNNTFLFSEGGGRDSHLTCWWIQQNTFWKYDTNADISW